MPYGEDVGHFRVLRPGVLGNVLIGAGAALISWGLYSRANVMPMWGVPPNALGMDQNYLLSGDFASALLLGIAGARWLTSEVDKRLLQAAASTAARAEPSAEAALQIAVAGPAQAASVARQMSSPPYTWPARNAA
jgi:hypothetical protein